MNKLLRRCPVASFVLLVFVVAYGVGLPLQMALGAFLPWLDATTAHYLGRVFIVGAPAIAAWVLTRALAGGMSAQQWCGQLRPTTIAWKWMPVAIFGFMAITVLAYFIAGLPAHAIQTTLSTEWARLMPIMFLEFAIVGIGEELGWRGWLLPTLLARGCSPLGASLRVGALWGIWHVPILLLGPKVALTFMITAIALSILQTALWLRSRASVLVAAAAHAAFNAPFAVLPSIEWTSVAAVSAISAFIVMSVGFRKVRSITV